MLALAGKAACAAFVLAILGIANAQPAAAQSADDIYAKAKSEGKAWGGRKAGTRVRLTLEKETVIGQLRSEGKSVASIARLVGLTRKTVYKAIKRTNGSV